MVVERQVLEVWVARRILRRASQRVRDFLRWSPSLRATMLASWRPSTARLTSGSLPRKSRLRPPLKRRSLSARLFRASQVLCRFVPAEGLLPRARLPPLPRLNRVHPLPTRSGRQGAPVHDFGRHSCHGDRHGTQPASRCGSRSHAQRPLFLPAPCSSPSSRHTIPPPHPHARHAAERSSSYPEPNDDDDATCCAKLGISVAHTGLRRPSTSYRLFDRMGGWETLSAAVEGVYRRLSNDERVGHLPPGAEQRLKADMVRG